jgi:hypothetical protein
MFLRAEDVLILISTKIEELKASLPDQGRRLEFKCFILTQEQWEALSKNITFKNEAEHGNANLGGIPIKFDANLSEMKIEYFQTEKQRKYFRLKRSRKHDLSTKETLQSQ